jgi:hypothetical protein
MQEYEGRGLPQEYEGRLSISRVSGNLGSYIEIKLDDAKAHVAITRIKVPIEDFGAIITGLSSQSVKYEANNFDKLGKTMEFKTEKIYVRDDVSLYKEEDVERVLRTEVSDHEIDGWVAEVENSLGRQNSTGQDRDGKYVNVQFRRWV